MNKADQYKVYIIAFFAIIALSLFFPLWEAAGITLTAVFLYNFFIFSQKSFDIRHLIILIATVQWVFGSILSYYFVPIDDAYVMMIDSSKYLSFTVLAIIFYAAGLFFPLKQSNIKKETIKIKISKILRANQNLDVVLIVIGLFFSIFSKVAPESLRFITFLLGGIKYVGLLLITTNPFRKKRKLIFAISAALLLLSAVLDGSFGTLTYWLILMYVIYDYLITISKLQKIILVVSAVFAILIMQSVKMMYREIVWFGGEKYSITEKLDLFSNLVEQQTQEGISNEETEKSTISRINQGWIISHTMNNMEHGGEFLQGETIYRTILSVILPGSLYGDKLMPQERREYFEIFTGRSLGRTVSMGISVLGEAYGNYGTFGASIFMFLFGLFLNISWLIVNRIILKYPLIIFFIPMLFQQVIKAENDFFVVLNHLVKSSIFILFIYVGLSKFYKLRS